MHNFTNEDLIQYIYNELNKSQRLMLEKELETNWALKEKLRVFTDAKNTLTQTKLFSPRKKTFDSIMKYASAGMPEPVSR